MSAHPLEHPSFSEIDRHFAGLINRLFPNTPTEVALAAAITSRQRSQGHSCIDLARLAGTAFPADPQVMAPPPFQLPGLDTWLAALQTSPAVGRPGDFRPLVLDAYHRLYLHRYWSYESQLATDVKVRAQSPADEVDSERLQDGLRRFFPETPTSPDDSDQRIAVTTAVQRQFCVISGGPGTGKTRTVVTLLALLLEQAGERPLRIALAAPTGKAAARLQESLQGLKATLPCSDQVKARLPDEAFTVHRLIGSSPDSARLKYNAQNPLPFDVVVVDEASMVDLSLMAKLFAATPATARLILLGDKDQLASVEAGAVLGDICHGAFAGEPSMDARPLADCIVRLQKNYRFGTDNGILALSQAINNGEAEQVLNLLAGKGNRFDGVAGTTLPTPSHLKGRLRERVLAGFGTAVATRKPAEALRALSDFRILSPVRQGPYGVESLNSLIEQILSEAGLISVRDRWYPGRPVMVTRNDYSLKLFNGDIGVILPDPSSGELRAWFPDGDKAPRSILPARLPDHETVFAMTVHKSQGSEFKDVLLILPDRENPVLTRELLYTGVTRASQRVELWFDESILRATVASRVERKSGLRDLLWG